ncbi:MAG: threonine--tRNA ligase, partial [Desulfobacterales bacterium]
ALQAHDIAYPSYGSVAEAHHLLSPHVPPFLKGVWKFKTVSEWGPRLRKKAQSRILVSSELMAWALPEVTATFCREAREYFELTGSKEGCGVGDRHSISLDRATHHVLAVTGDHSTPPAAVDPLIGDAWAFHQDDAHIFMTPEQIQGEILSLLSLEDRMYSTFGLGYHLELSTRPDKSIGTDEQWKMATDGLRSALDAYGQDYKINEGDGAFYGPKIDLHIKDALGRTWQCGTIQLDMSLPERFDLYYVDKDNEKHRPIMLHRTVFGSIERFLGILIEHFAGKFPLWMAPVQVVLLPINDDLVAYTDEIGRRLQREGLRCEVDSRAESLNKKIREAQLQYIPLILTIGNKEKTSGTLSVRTLDGTIKQGISQDVFINTATAAIRERRLDMDMFKE